MATKNQPDEGEQKQSDQVQHQAKAAERDKGPATFSGDVRGGGPGAGADLGRGGTSTPTGDLAGGGQPSSTIEFGEGTVTADDPIPTGGSGGLAKAEHTLPVREELPEKPLEGNRSAIDNVPGIPAGSDARTKEALRTPDSELGGVVASDTTPQGPTADKPDEEQVRREDKERNTL